MQIDWILGSIVLCVLFVASLFDLFSKTQEIPDWLSYGLMLVVLGVRAMYAVFSGQASFFLWGLLIGGIAFVLAALLFYTRQWGGGDSKLLIGIGIAFATPISLGVTSFDQVPFLLGLILNILFVGAAYGLLWAIGLGVRHFSLVLSYLKKQQQIRFVSSFFIVSVAFGIVLWLFSGIVSQFVLVLGVLVEALLCLCWTYPCLKAIEVVILQQWVPVADLTPGDWPVQDVKVGKTVLYKTLGIGLEEKHLRLFQKYHIKKVFIKRGIPFAPSLFFAVLITLVYGSILPLAPLLGLL